MNREVLEQARDALVAAGITGPHKSHSRRNAIGKIRQIIAGDTDDTFGLSGLAEYSPEEILGFVSKLTGCSPDLASEDGYDTIDPELTIDGIVNAAKALKGFAAKGATLLIATGHPTGMLEHNIRVADAYQRAGGRILRLREGEQIVPGRSRKHEVRYTGGVGCLADWGALLHTHSAAAMEALLEEEPWPEVVFGDHGWAGAAIERGIPTIAVVDINDPALAVAWAQGKDMWAIPLDDNRAPALYEPSWKLFEQILEYGL